MIIVVEGLDKTGKSTIIQDLTSLHSGAVVFKLSQKPFDNSEKEIQKVKTSYVELFNQARKLSKKGFVVIFDRAYPSELVYSIKRGYDAFSDPFWIQLDHDLANDISILYCTAKKETIVKRFLEQKEDYAKEEEISLLLERYQKFISMTLVPVTTIDTDLPRETNYQQLSDLY